MVFGLLFFVCFLVGGFCFLMVFVCICLFWGVWFGFFSPRNILCVNVVNHIIQVPLFIALWYICIVYYDPCRVSVTLKRGRFVAGERL